MVVLGACGHGRGLEAAKSLRMAVSLVLLQGNERNPLCVRWGVKINAKVMKNRKFLMFLKVSGRCLYGVGRSFGTRLVHNRGPLVVVLGTCGHGRGLEAVKSLRMAVSLVLLHGDGRNSLCVWCGVKIYAKMMKN